MLYYIGLYDMRVLRKELKARELVRKSDSSSINKSKSIHGRIEKTADNTAFFSVQSQSSPGKKYIVSLSAPSITEDSTESEIKEILKDEDVKVACSCDAFLYQGYKFITYKANAGIDPEGRVPVKRNPRQQGMLCKHIIAVFHKLGIS